jgi:hypothetical protein
MKKKFFALLMMIASLALTSVQAQNNFTAKERERAGGDKFEIQTMQTYPQNYDVFVKQARKEQE